jgi:hypothetical protein
MKTFWNSDGQRKEYFGKNDGYEWQIVFKNADSGRCYRNPILAKPRRHVRAPKIDQECVRKCFQTTLWTIYRILFFPVKFLNDFRGSGGTLSTPSIWEIVGFWVRLMWHFGHSNNWCFGEIFEWFLDFLEKNWKIQWSVSERNRSMPSGKCSIFVGFNTINHHHEDRRVENHPMLRGSQPAGNHTFGHLGWKETPSTGKSQPANPNNLEY